MSRGAEGPARGRSVLVTGAGGYVGSQVVRALVGGPSPPETIVAMDVRPPGAEAPPLPGVVTETRDVRAPGLEKLLRQHGIDTVVHLAAVVSPRPDQSREELFDIEVGGTRRLVEACADAGVGKVIFASSGAAYGYHPDNPPLLTEDHPLRGNEAFAYAWHKRKAEEELEALSERFPALEQLVFRVCSVLGEDTETPITRIFSRPIVVGVRGSETPFCFIWDRDLVQCIVRGVSGPQIGAYNVAGDGALGLGEIARALGRRFVPLPPFVLRGALRVLRRLGIGPYGPEQVVFLQHRPVLDNARLRRDFEGLPTRTSREVFELYRRARAR